MSAYADIVERAARALRHMAHVYHTVPSSKKEEAREELYRAARVYVAAEGNIIELATRAIAFGVDELTISAATEAQIRQLSALPGARCGKQPMQSLAAGVWMVLETVRVEVHGVTFAARRSYPATPAELEAIQKLWRVG